MTPERFQKIEEIFCKAAEMPASERTAFLESACAGDEELRSEVEALLLKEEDTEAPFQSLIIGAAGSLPGAQAEFVGRRVGAYRITGIIGQGGMAEVYKAVRDDDHYQKEVAIKLVRPGRITSFMLARFRYERQILASLEHTNIARLLDGGATDDDLPYFVMEYIEGQPITDYAEANNLSVKKRLKLFRAACAAVQFAHRNLVVHRDLKPSNILVTKEGVPKLLDFGIAKLLAPEVSSMAVTVAQTMTMMRLMTPDYASPEQVKGEPVTTATDVYALGAVLYELLTGERPHRFKERSMAEIERVICELEVERPSVVAARSNRASHKLRRVLEGDLDNIILMALRKEPERRYGSVDQLSEDVRRYLEGRPVRARNDTLLYRAGKFIRRHKAPVTVAASIVVLLITFSALVGLQAARIARERDRANKVSDFLVEVFGASDPGHARGDTVTAREILDNGAGKIRRELQGQPDVQAALMDTMGRAYYRLGLYDSALPMLKDALELRRKTLGAEHVDVASTMNNLALVFHAKGDFGSAEQLYRDALVMRRKLFGERSSETATSLNNFGLFLKDKGDYEASESNLRQALNLRRALFGSVHIDVAETLNELGVLLHRKGSFSQAEPMAREALEMRKQLLGEDHPAVAESTNNLATLLDSMGRLAEAEPLSRQALALYRRLLGDEHPHVAVSMSNLAGLLKRRRDYAGAEQLYRQALSIMRKAHGDEHPETATMMNNLASLLRETGDYDAAEALFRRALEVRRKLLKQGHPSIILGLQNLGTVLMLKGDMGAAESLYREAMETAQKALPAEHWLIAESHSNYGACMLKLKRYAQAEEHLLAGYNGLKKAMGDENARTQKAVSNLVELYTAWGKQDEASRYAALLRNKEKN
jgi:serine/threonine protein kinase/Tfp pilus assembly protein PilF